MIAKIIAVLTFSSLLLHVSSQTEPLVVTITSAEDLTDAVKQQMREAALKTLNIYRALHKAPPL